MTDSRPPPSSADLGAQLADLRRLRRPREGRKIAGVCAGLGEHLRIDPVVLRVVLAVMVVFGGTGALLYGAGWLLIPDEGSKGSVMEQQLGRRPDGAPDKAVLIGGIVVLLLLVASLPWWGFSWHPGVLMLLAVIGLFALSRRQRGDSGRTTVTPEPGPTPTQPTETAPPTEQTTTPIQAPPMAPADQPTQPTQANQSTQSAQPVGTDPTVPVLGSWRNVPPAPPAFWSQPDPLGLEAETEPLPAPAAPPPAPPVPVARSRLFAGTMACALIVLGVLAAYDLAVPSPLPAGGYIAAALGVVGLGLVTGAWIGRSPGLVVTGIVLALALAPATILDYVRAHPDHFVSEIAVRPSTLAGAEQAFDYDAGRVRLDLRDVPFEDGRITRTSVDLGAGDLIVILPPDVDVEVNGDVGLGDLRVLGEGNGGPDASQRVVDVGDDGEGGGQLRLNADVGVGSLEVRRG